MRILRLNDNSEYELSSCVVRPGELIISLEGTYAVKEIADVFSDPDKTCHMTDTTDEAGSLATDYDGYTDLISVRRKKHGTVFSLQTPVTITANPVPET